MLVRTPTLDSLTSEPREEDEVDRRTANRAISATFAGLVVPTAALGALQAAVERIGTQDRVDVALIADHEQLADAYALLDRTTRPSRLFIPAAHQADTLDGLLDRPISPTLRDRLGVVATGSHAQAGKLAFLAGDRTVARRYFALAVDIAEDSRNDTVHAQTLGVASCAHRQPRGRASTMMARAVDLVVNTDRDTQAWLHSWHAMRLADTDDERGFRVHMERADRMRAGAASGTGFLMRYGAYQCSQLGVELAAGLTTLKRGAEAQLVKREPDPEAACSDLVASFELGRDGGVATSIERVHRVRRLFPKRCAGSAYLGELDERLALV